MSMTPEQLAELREHYDTTSTADEMTGAGHWESDVDPDPMVTTSLRLPRSLLDWVRARAAVEKTKPTALVRRWIEEQRDHESIPRPTVAGDDLVERLERLERAVFDTDR